MSWTRNANGTYSFETREYGSITVPESEYFNNTIGEDLRNLNTTRSDYHEYSVTTSIAFSTDQLSFQFVSNALGDYLTPTHEFSVFGLNFAGPGYVSSHRTSTESYVNVTGNIGGVSVHALEPGAVQRSLVVIDGIYHIRTVGIGIGIFPNVNEQLAPPAFANADAALVVSLLNEARVRPEGQLGVVEVNGVAFDNPTSYLDLVGPGIIAAVTGTESSFLRDQHLRNVNSSDINQQNQTNIRREALQQFEAGTIDPVVFLNPSFNPNRGGGVWGQIAQRVAQITQPWDKITIAYSPNGIGGSFGLDVVYSSGNSETLSTLVVDEVNIDEVALYAHNTVTLTSTVEGVNTTIARPDGTVVAEAIIDHNADGTINGAKINNFLSGDVALNTTVFSEDGTNRLEISLPEIVIPDVDELNRQQLSALEGQIGGIFGSTIGNLLTDQIGGVEGTVAGLVVSELLADVGAAFGAALGEGGNLLENFGSNLDTAFQSFGLDLAGAGIGVVSSLLTAEIADVLGLDGLAAEVFGLNYNGVVSAAVARGVEPFLSLISQDLAKALVDSTTAAALNPANLIGGFIGAKLGSLVVSPTTQAGAILSSLGSSIGGVIGGVKLGSSLGSIVPGLGTAVGAFVGFVLGALIGNLFGKKKPKIPQASADTLIDYVDGRFVVMNVQSRNNGNEDFVSDLAQSAADTLNGFIAVMTQGSDTARVIDSPNTRQTYGHGGTSSSQANDIYVTLNGRKNLVDNGAEAVELGVLTAIRNTRIAGGDLFIKRAVLASQAEDFVTFGGDLQIAEEYGEYIRNQETLNALITGGTDETTGEVSVQAAGWIITLQRAAELGLNRSAVSDFYGGAKGFVDSLAGIVDRPIDYEDIAFKLEGDDLELYFDADHDGIADAGEELLFDETGFLREIGHADGGVGYNQATSDSTLTQGNDILIGASGRVDDLTIQSVYVPGSSQWVGYGADRELRYTPGRYVSRNLEGGDDIIIGDGSDNEIYGRSGFDWLDGGDGNDELHGGIGDDVLLARSGDDFLYGEDGDDVLVAGSGSDTLDGGAGDDALYDTEQGMVTAQGGSGDDVYYTRALEGGTAQSLTFNGGSGQDIFSFREYDNAVDITLSAASSATYNIGNNSFTLGTIEGFEGSSFSDDITGNGGHNTLLGGAGDDTLAGGLGNDILEGGTGVDVIDGGSGVDTLSYENSLGGVDVSIQTEEALGGGHAFGADASGDSFTNIENLTGSGFADVLEGSDESNIIEAGGGDDYIIATRGTDIIRGGDGFDTVDYGNHIKPPGIAGRGGVADQGLTINATEGGFTYGYNNGVNGVIGSDRLYGIEHIVGTQNADSIRFGAGDNVLEGGRGNDYLYGGAGNDIYFVELGGGSDWVYEYGNAGHDVIQVGYEENLSWDDVVIGIGSTLSVTVKGQRLANAINGPVSKGSREEVGVDAIDIGGVGSVDIWYLDKIDRNGRLGTAWNDHLRGTEGGDGSNLLQGGNGNDTLWGNEKQTEWEDESNILHGGRGNDTIYASVGDDQYIFDRGSGRDTVTDAGGQDHIQFGPGVALSELVFTIVGNDLYIGIADEGTTDTSDLRANAMADYIRIVGGVGSYNYFTGGYNHSGRLLEYITVENTNIDLRTLDFWEAGSTVSTTTTGTTDPAVPVFDWSGFDFTFDFSNFTFFPIGFDLDGDGLELTSIEDSQIVMQADNGWLFRLGWLSGDDGWLALDRDGDGRINRLSEISFVGDYEGATTDLEGLRGFDSNEDGVFDSADERFGDFTIWRDIDQNGRSSEGELLTLEEAGISSINLGLSTSGNDVADFADSVVLNTAEYTTTDGETRTTYDVALRGSIIAGGREFDYLTEDLATEIYSELEIEGELGGDRLGRISAARVDVLEQEAAQEAGENMLVTPIVLDLDGDGELSLTHFSQSGVEIDVNNDGTLDRIGWVLPEDGILGLDRNGDGLIEAVSEISFVEDLAGAQTDLEGLVAFDSNGNGLIDSGDARFADFRVWQDANQDGISQTDELVTLSEAGLASINLTAHIGRETSNQDVTLDNIIFGQSEVLYTDGPSSVAGDVGLRAEFVGVISDIATGEYMTGFVGLEHVHVEAAERFEDVAINSAWGQIVGHRSPLLARLQEAAAQAEAEALAAAQAEIEAADAAADAGTDIGANQDDLLAELEAQFADDDADAIEGSVVSDAVENTNLADSASGEVTPIDKYVAAPETLKEYDSLVASLEAPVVGANASEYTEAGDINTTYLSVQTNTSLDQLTQAMASFDSGATSASLNRFVEDDVQRTDLLAASSTFGSSATLVA